MESQALMLCMSKHRGGASDENLAKWRAYFDTLDVDGSGSLEV